ncbi:MAG: hypothetical protein FWD58_02045 [Firmicutes bacterium]|nr:hypothetical protein [Bacillota bacterium]
MKKVCVSSVIVSGHFREFRFIAKKAIEFSGFKAECNNEDSGATQRNFKKILREDSPIFLLVLGEYFSDTVADECKIAIEEGLHIIPLLHVDKDLPYARWPEQLKNNMLKTIPLKMSKDDCTCFSTPEELYDQITRRLGDYEEETDTLIDVDDAIYVNGTTLIKDAKSKIILGQKTSTLFLGPQNGRTNEQSFYDILIDWLSSSDTQNKTLIHIYTKSEYNESDSNYNIASAKENLVNILSELPKNVRIIFRSAEDVFPMVMADYNLLLPFVINRSNKSILLPNYRINKQTLKRFESDFEQIGTHVFDSKNSFVADAVIRDIYGN